IVGVATTSHVLSLGGNLRIDEFHSLLILETLLPSLCGKHHDNVVGSLNIGIQVIASRHGNKATIDTLLLHVIFSCKLQVSKSLCHVRHDIFQFHVFIPHFFL